GRARLPHLRRRDPRHRPPLAEPGTYLLPDDLLHDGAPAAHDAGRAPSGRGGHRDQARRVRIPDRVREAPLNCGGRHALALPRVESAVEDLLALEATRVGRQLRWSVTW